MDRLWRAHDVPAEKVYNALSSIVFPEKRSKRVFLYARRFDPDDWSGPSSAGEVLAHRAVEAEKTDELGKEVAARLQRSESDLDARILAVMLGAAAEDAEGGNDALQWLIDRLQKNYRMSQARTMLFAAVAGLRNEATAKKATLLMQRVSEILTGGDVWGNTLIERIRQRNAESASPSGVENGITRRNDP